LNAKPLLDRLATDTARLRDREARDSGARAIRDRQAAVVHLRAAAGTADSVQRDFLRRRAAELVLPRGMRWSEASDLGSPPPEPRPQPATLPFSTTTPWPLF